METADARTHAHDISYRITAPPHTYRLPIYRWYLVRRVDFGPGETLKEPNNLLAVRILVAARALSCVPAWPSRGGALTNTTQNAWHAARLVACGDMNPYMNP